MTKSRDHVIRARLNDDEREAADRLIEANPHIRNDSELIRWMIAMYASMERAQEDE